MNLECQTCFGPIELNNSKSKASLLRISCSASCAARFSNIVYPKRGGTKSFNLEKTAEGFYKYCFSCGECLPLDRNRVFCDRICWRSFWDEVQRPEKAALKKTQRCRRCEVLVSRGSVHCSPCFQLIRKEKRIQDWLRGVWNGADESNEYALSRSIRNYLLAQANFECSRCGFGERHPDGSCILQINHIDGHANNHAPENLEVLCPNCHALTETHGGRNRGRGRPGRVRTRPHEG